MSNSANIRFSPRSYLEDCQSRKVIFFTGKGGVGKTTLAWATAVACRREGARITLASWNPFDDVTTPTWANDQGIRWIPLETLSAFREYSLNLLKFEKVYDAVFDNRVLKTFIKAAPGLSETVIAGKIWDLVDKREQDLVIVDLPSSGHAISFFQSPLGIQKIFSTGFVHKESGKIVKMFQERWCRIDLVALPEELPLVECLQLKQKLETLHPFHFGYLHLNQCTPTFPLPHSQNCAPLPDAVISCLERYRSRHAQEEEAMGLSWDFHLPTHYLPRFPSEGMKEILHKTATFLESA